MCPPGSLVVLRDGGGCNKGHRQAVSKQGQRQAFSRQQAAMVAARGVARRLPSKAGAHLAFFKLALDTEVDLYCGWDQYEHSKDMQIHYAGQQRSHRVKRRMITKDI